MLRRMLISRGFVSVLAAVVVAVVAVAAYLLVLRPPVATKSYCAMFPDTIGLYVGNHVTLRGMAVGEITAIDPRGETVRVDFTVDERHPVPEDAAAVTVSDTIVADRQLAVLPGRDPGRTRDENGCITRTLTPKSMTQTLDAVAGLAAQTLGPESGTRDALRRGLAALDSATAGTGPEINAGITDLAALLDSPDAAIGRLGGLIDSLAAISGSVAQRWGDIRLMLTRLATVLDQVNNQLFSRTVEIIDGFQRVLPMLNEITSMFGDPIFRVLDASIPLVRLIRVNVDTLRDIVVRVPVLAAAAQSVADPARGLDYAPPAVAVPPEVAAQLCALGGAPDCASDPGRIPLSRLVFGLVGAR
ncbi:virulence factor Mce-like protein [Nocardia neocaledoniensis]|uniref:Virulence factor Mce-like protein n=2 Tax=Nocardia neocaledoniensis TaxID=236511 RepID=A0A317N719_9NOCA|nr:virulence factor Mce-like protein [Nocardia neocaledoniensis]